MNETIKINNKKLIKQIAKLKEIAGKEKWFYLYDKKLDQLSYAPKVLQSNYVLYSLTDDFTVYIDSQSNLKGLFIEYYSSNLAEHELEFKQFVNAFSEKIDGSSTIPSNKFAEATLLTDAIQAKMLSEIILRDNQLTRTIII